MNSFRTMFPIFGVIAVLAGCSAESSTNGNVDSASNAQSKSTVAKDVRAPEGKGFHARMHGGPEFLLFAALREDIKLTPEQRTTIEGLVAQNKPKEPSEKARAEVRDPARVASLAAGIRAGKVDAALLKSTHEGHEAAMKERTAANASALATLHKTLTKEQRVALVDAMAANRAKHEGKEHKFGRPGAEGQERHPAMHDMHEGRAPLDGLLEGLDLTSAQQETIRTKTAAITGPSDADREAMKTKFEAMKKDREAKLQSFKNDEFDATAFVAPPVNADAAAHKQSHAARMAEQLSVVVSVLDAAQREKLAQKIEQGPPARPQGHMGRPAR